MEHINNAQDKEITRGRKKRLIETQREGLDAVRLTGQVIESQQISVSHPNSTRKDSDWKLTPVRDTAAGKILERLESLETKYLEYVDSHQARLKARLEESKEDKQDFLQESNQIKSDIYHLAVAQQQANGNGHIN